MSAEADADPSIVIRAAESGDVELLRAHLHEHPDSVRVRDGLGRTALHAAASAGEIGRAKVLIEHGAEIDARDGPRGE